MRRLSLAAAAMVVATAGQAQSLAKHPRIQEAAAGYEKWLDAERAFKKIPGIAAVVVVDQEVIWQGATGLADLARKAPATPSTLFSICSISKLFTSLATLQLRDQGKLRLDDPVSKHLPWFRPKKPGVDPGEITIEGLLTHAAGLQREAADTYWLEPAMEFPSHEDVVRAAPDREVDYPPERYFQYSNLGFTLLGAVVTAASGTPYLDYARQHLLGPLRMANTFPEMPPEERGKRLAMGYSGIDRDGNRHPMPFYQTRAMASAAGYASSPLDLAAFASWHFRLLNQGGTEVIAANTLREMQRVHYLDPSWETTWGLGYSIWRHDNTTFVGHGGSCPGYRTQLLLEPTSKVATITAANTFDADADGMAQRAYEFFAPAVKAARADSAGRLVAAEASLDRYLGTYWSFGGEMEVIRWEGGLATMQLPNDAPVKRITKLRKVGEHTFREVREDGSLAERLSFDVDAQGQVYRARSNYLHRRIRR
ncbi:MAG: beta-lactamase family protein [Gemmatimonadetes bacterium]|nr:beta-lactamase family protein [Gemmatimonadota bacterium]